MNNFKKKILTGLLSGALILTGSQALAAPPDFSDDDKDWQAEAEAHRGGWAKFISERYGVDTAQVEAALNDGTHIEDIRHAAILAKLSGRNFSDVLAMKVDWPQIAEKLGVTREQMRKFFKQEREESFAKHAGIDVKTFQSLVKDGYNPHDIDVAARIAKAAGKDVKSVLGKRKINNTWEDVAKSYGVDMKKIMPPPPGHFGHRGQHRGHHGQPQNK